MNNWVRALLPPAPHGRAGLNSARVRQPVLDETDVRRIDKGMQNRDQTGVMLSHIITAVDAATEIYFPITPTSHPNVRAGPITGVGMGLLIVRGR
jgi:hypothetical protein